MQDSNPQADGNAEARSRDEWRSDRSADTVLRDGGADTDSGGRRRGSEGVGRGGGGGATAPGGGRGGSEGGRRGGGGENLLECLPPNWPSPQRLKTRHPIKP